MPFSFTTTHLRGLQMYGQIQGRDKLQTFFAGKLSRFGTSFNEKCFYEILSIITGVSRYSFKVHIENSRKK